MPRQASLISAKMPTLAAQAICGGVQSLVLAGSTAADAAKITSGFVLLTTASAGGAALPPSQAGDSFEIKNESGSTCTLYPSSTAGTVTINTTTSLSVPTAKSCRVWFSSPTACHSTPTVVS
jgi:hypothetical protein